MLDFRTYTIRNNFAFCKTLKRRKFLERYKMKNLKLFFRTPDFAAKSLEAIHQSHHEIVGVVTVADKPSGRGQNLPNLLLKICCRK